jgi:F-type H+-transporting ATPase subunit epsilon
MNTFELHILAAQRDLFEGQAESLIVPTTEGMYGIQAKHMNMIAGIIPGELTFRPEGEADLHAFVSNGMVIVKDGEVTVLVGAAEYPDEIDVNRAERAAEQAREEMVRHKSKRVYAEAQRQLARATSRLKVSKIKR